MARGAAGSTAARGLGRLPAPPHAGPAREREAYLERGSALGPGLGQRAGPRSLFLRLRSGGCSGGGAAGRRALPLPPRPAAPGPRLPAPGSRLPAPGSRPAAPGSRPAAPPSRLRAPRRPRSLSGGGRSPAPCALCLFSLPD
ncbi:hypothetical protein VULLAG_LOCUS21958 [Vulpes lagopus]